MKRKLVALLAAVMMVSLAACGSSDSGDSKKEDTAKEETKGGSGDTLIVGTEAGFAPYEYMKGTEVVGIDMDIAKAIAEDMGKELEIKNMDFDGALAAVQSGKVDMVAAGVSIDEERKQVMDFSDEYVDNTEVVVVNKENPGITAASGEVTGEDLEGKIVGVQQGNIADIWVANKDNANPKEIKRYSKFAQAVEDLKNGKIDGIIIDQYPAEEMVASNDSLTIMEGTLFQDKYAIAVKKGNQELLDQINKVIKQLKDDGKIEEFTANHVGN
jgi:ABC-type amino acid transport substrate-binding protein